MSALLKVLSDPRPFQDSTGGYSSYPFVGDTIDDYSSEYDAFLHFRDTIASYLKTIKPVDGLGTKKDYDMVLVPLIGMLYGLKDVKFYDHAALGLSAQQSLAITNEMAYDILCHDSDACHNDNRPYFSFKTGRQFLTADIEVWNNDVWYQPETENHVLNALTWSFLATQWVRWQGRITDPSHDRYYAPMVQMRVANETAWANVQHNLRHLLLQVLARPVHRGFFETNALPYQADSLHAIYTLAAFANLPVDPDRPGYTGDIGQAALNALHYLAAKFAFQSYRGKRMAPMRRRWDKRYRLRLYGNGTERFMAMFSGSYDYNDCWRRSSAAAECFYPWHRDFTQTGGRLLSLLLSDLTLPSPIHGHMLFKPTYFARMLAHYGKDDYPSPCWFECWQDMALDDPDLYLNSKGGRFIGQPELYFGTPDLLLTAGGRHEKVYDSGGTYAFLARPTSLLYQGDFGTDWDGDDNHADIDVVKKDILTMRGNRRVWPKGRCNVWVYKNFAYGYKRIESGTPADTEYHNGWPQTYPDWWEGYLEEEFSINHSWFRIFDFPAGVLGEASGHYFMVISKLRKHDAKWPHEEEFYKYRRGFVEIVPGGLFYEDFPDPAAALRDEIIALNPDWHLNQGEAGTPWIYTLPSTKDTLTLAPKMGAGPDGKHECSTGILSVAEHDPAQGTTGPAWDQQQMVQYFLPKDVSKRSELKRLPLITVWELGYEGGVPYRRTGRKLVETIGPGRIAVRRRASVCTSWNQITNPPTCLQYQPGWQCLLIDSSQYDAPSQSYIETTQYANCWPGS